MWPVSSNWTKLDRYQYLKVHLNPLTSLDYLSGVKTLALQFSLSLTNLTRLCCPSLMLTTLFFCPSSQGPLFSAGGGGHVLSGGWRPRMPRWLEATYVTRIHPWHYVSHVWYVSDTDTCPIHRCVSLEYPVFYYFCEYWICQGCNPGIPQDIN
jgi:hypothetical protein